MIKKTSYDILEELLKYYLKQTKDFTIIYKSSSEKWRERTISEHCSVRPVFGILISKLNNVMLCIENIDISFVNLGSETLNVISGN